MAEIYRPSLDAAWLSAIQAACRSPRHEVSPLVVTFDALEDESSCGGVRCALDEGLIASGCATVETVANTLFPNSFWNPAKNRKDLFQRYLKILPILRRHNPRGIYFERLINYRGKRGEQGLNQLDHIISTFRSGNHRRSGLQAAVLVPASDLTNSRRQGFPCLQQVAFLPNRDSNTLAVAAFYPTQYLFERAYGNYLGLVRLGRFMAHEMALELREVTCIAAVGMLEVPLRTVEPLIAKFAT